jgi:hypothetical protein
MLKFRMLAHRLGNMERSHINVDSDRWPRGAITGSAGSTLLNYTGELISLSHQPVFTPTSRRLRAEPRPTTARFDGFSNNLSN